MVRRVYLDNAATTCVDNRVIEKMIPYFTKVYGNPSSLHSFGTIASDCLNNSRAKIANLVGAEPGEIYFTSGGTESNNLALKGVAFANKSRGNHIIVSAVEHDCIMNTCKWLNDNGFEVSYIPVDSKGILDVQEFKKLLNPVTILVSVMHANNEIGTIEPMDEIGDICRFHNISFHSDACQSFGKIPIDVQKAKVDLLTINSHKIYGPKGVGALYIRKGISIEPLFHGGGQESGVRSTTENLSGIVGFAEAAELCISELAAEQDRLLGLRNSLTGFLFDNFDNAYINGSLEKRLPGHLNFSFHGLEGETIRLLLLLDEIGIAVSAGSACSSNDKTHSASHVLQAIGLNQFEARGGIRVSFGRFTTEDDLEYFKSALKSSVESLTSIFSNNTFHSN